jgi:hypothetical protein
MLEEALLPIATLLNCATTDPRLPAVLARAFVRLTEVLALVSGFAMAESIAFTASPAITVWIVRVAFFRFAGRINLVARRIAAAKARVIGLILEMGYA